jgi:hypothetical protein
MLIIIIAIFSIIVAEQNTHLTEGRRLDMNQGARVIEQMLYDGFRSAGSVLSLANTAVLLNSSTIPFNGVYPLNNDIYPDGVILAAGDPMALTRLTTVNFAPGSTEINVQTVNLPPDGINPPTLAWHNGDYGIIMRPDGYYVFQVDDTDLTTADTSFTVRGTSAYFSGLLSIPPDPYTYFPGYNDQCDEQFGTTGNIGDYPVGSPVLRLEYFNIFLTRTETDGTRTLTLTTDCANEPDVLANPTDRRGVPILPNIEDIQIEYISRDAVPVIWAGSDATYAGGTANFYTQFYTKNIASARIFVLLRTEEEKNKHQGSGIVFDKPAMGDVAATTLPVGRYHYTYMQYEVLIRNYNNVL